MQYSLKLRILLAVAKILFTTTKFKLNYNFLKLLVTKLSDS